MKRAILSPLAQQDLRSIWLYSAEQWGRRRASRYLADIREIIEKLAERPQVGKSEAALRQGYFRRLAGSHVIFYRMADGGLDIVRILHQSMDFDRHL